MSPFRNSEGLPEIPLGNFANSLFLKEDSLEITSTEISSERLLPPATKMDFGWTEMKKKRTNQDFVKNSNSDEYSLHLSK